MLTTPLTSSPLHITSDTADLSIAGIEPGVTPLNKLHPIDVDMADNKFESIQLAGPLDEGKLAGGMRVKLTSLDGEVAETQLGGYLPDEVRSDADRRFQEVKEG